MTPLYYKYPYSLQSLQTEVDQSNLKMGGYFILAFWSNHHNTGLQSHVGFSSQEKQYTCHKQHSLSSSPTGCLHERAEHTAQAGLPNKQRNSTEKWPASAYSEIWNKAKTNGTAGNTAESMAKHGHGNCSSKMQTTKPSSGQRGAHARFGVYFYLMLGIATF